MQSSGKRTTSLSATLSSTRMTSAAFASGSATTVRIEAQVKRTNPNRFIKIGLTCTPIVCPGRHSPRPHNRHDRQGLPAQRIDRPSLPRVEQESRGFKALRPRRAHPRTARSPLRSGPRMQSTGLLLSYHPGISMPKSIRNLAVGLLVLSPASPLTAQTPPPGAPPAPARRPFAKPDAPRRTERIREVDIKHIKGELTLDLGKKEVRGKVTHRLTPLHPYLTRVEFDCGPELKVSKVAAGPGAAECKFEHKGEKLVITLDKPYGPDDTIDLAISYAGSPESGLHFVTPDPAYPNRPTAIWTQGEAEDNHHWLPCYDYPNDRVTTEMIITIARPFSVVSNGVLVDTRENADGTRTFHWKMDQPHSTYLITVAAADFVAFHDKVDSLPVDYYVTRNVDEATARRFMGKTPGMIRFYNLKIGQPYAYPKYAQVCLPEFGGGMENPSAPPKAGSAPLDKVEALEQDMDGLVAHELAHQWFGDLLTCKDWSNIWLNEGFASYFDPLFAEHDLGEDEFRLRMEGELRSYLGNDRQYRRPIVETRYGSPMEMFDSMTYAKGGCVLHMLRGLLGDEAWWKGIRG